MADPKEPFINVEVVNLGGYYPGAKTRLPLSEAQRLAKEGHVRILDKLPGENKLSPEVENKGGKNK